MLGHGWFCIHMLCMQKLTEVAKKLFLCLAFLHITLLAHITYCCTCLQENDVRQLFAPFGSISSIEIVKDAGGQSQGYGYVEFTSMPDASKAMQQWDGQEVVGQKLSVKIAPLAPGQAQTFAMPQLDLDDDEGQCNALCS